MSWIPILFIILIAILLTSLLLVVVALSAQRGGWGAKLLKRVGLWVMRFGPTKRLALKIANRAFKKSGQMPGAPLGSGGLDPRMAKQTEGLLASMSDEGRERLFEASLEMERAEPERRQELEKEVTGIVAGDLNIGRAQRRAMERAQARQSASGQSRPQPKSSTKSSAKSGKGKKKRR